MIRAATAAGGDSARRHTAQAELVGPTEEAPLVDPTGAAMLEYPTGGFDVNQLTTEEYTADGFADVPPGGDKSPGGSGMAGLNGDEDPPEPGPLPASDACPGYTPTNQPNNSNPIAYKTFKASPTGPYYPLNGDYWLSTPPPGSWPVIIVAHGGGWWRGCRRAAASLGVEYRNRALVFSIEFRLACEGWEFAQNSLLLAEHLCGWKYKQPDHETGLEGAAIQDLRDAVAWVRANAPTMGIGFNGKVYIIGGSSGGNLAYMVGGTSSGSSRPNAVAGWSGPTELGNVVTPEPGYGPNKCDQPPFDQDPLCYKATMAYYMGCTIKFLVPPDPNLPLCPFTDTHTYWDKSSPVWLYAAGGSPAFMANGIAEEHIKFWEVTDLQIQLNFAQVPNQPCPVPGTGHGLGLLDQNCNGETGPRVADATWDFFTQY